ncbi:MAG: putative SapB synthase, partial [Kribbellaceae bacterium]|nr:putative SapB synthase [Kribbellaceae bacterium]
MESYELYCLADRRFYDSPTNRGAEHPDFALCSRPVPAGWSHVPGETWMHYAPDGLELPAQGWKIHVSSGLEDAERTLAVVWDYCVPRGIAFKFLRNEPVMVMVNSKSAPRGSSGKLVTIYPTDEAQLELVLKELDGLLQGVRGPYILSDLRYAEGPLFVRYGAFVSRYCLNEGGERVLALSDDTGRLVPDHRGPTFSMPPWVALPPFLQEHLDARNSVTTNELAYTIEGVIQFSNGGGVYLG